MSELSWWAAFLLAGAAGTGLGIGVVIGALLARVLRRLIRYDDRGE